MRDFVQFLTSFDSDVKKG